jgi:hypothetical protein
MCDNNTGKDNLRPCALQLREQGTKLFAAPRHDPNPFEYPYTLGLALIAAAELFEIVSSGNDLDLASLFDGGEDRGPNLYTRMKCVRDLCSAAVWPISLRNENSLAGLQAKSTSHCVMPSAELWHRIIARFANTSAPDAVSEISALMDDTMESLLCISELLRHRDRNDSYQWTEIQRHTEHVRDHFDYAEETLIASLRPANEGDGKETAAT